MIVFYVCQFEDSCGCYWFECMLIFCSLWQWDCDRIIYFSVFCRLKYKMQVFVEYDGQVYCGDYFCIWLIYMIEVVQVVCIIVGVLDLNFDLVEIVVLVYDLGYLFFGYIGEDVLVELMVFYGGFDYNVQVLCIVIWLECYYVDFDGLNLIWESFEGIVKYNGLVMGVLFYVLVEVNVEWDLELYINVSVEVQVVVVVDDVVYNYYDLYDGLCVWLFIEDDLL